MCGAITTANFLSLGLKSDVDCVAKSDLDVGLDTSRNGTG